MVKNKLEKISKKIPKSIQDQLAEFMDEDKRKSHVRFILAALGSIPWVGGFLGAMAAKDAEKEQKETNLFQQLWLQEHEEKVNKLGYTLFQILSRLDKFDEEVQARISSSEYLDLVRKGFRSWDQSDTEEKRELIRKLLTNAGAVNLCPDDLVRLFLDWIDMYHEAHFKVIREIYQNPGITRGKIWDNIKDERPREDSAEADLFKLLIRDLSTGSVIRQERATDNAGNFLKQKKVKLNRGSKTMKSAFDDSKSYFLTELGKQFVHYTMEEVVVQIED
ncbi:MAG: hypothetical protein ACKUBY_01835 [Candidatus Moraniibacteriota bacterium]|jgi:hypothetical protein